jgi:V8-like Glu-specific endopeptidase
VLHRRRGGGQGEHAVRQHAGGSLWYNAGRVRKMEKTYVEYMVDTEGGQSGSPIYFFDEEKTSGT